MSVAPQRSRHRRTVLGGAVAVTVLAVAVGIALVIVGGGNHPRRPVTAPHGASRQSASSHSVAGAQTNTPPAGVRDCLAHLSACGYPDRSNTGVPVGMALTPRTGTIDVTTPGQTISGLALNGAIEVNADNTTIRDDRIVVSGTQRGCGDPCGGRGIYIAPGVKNTRVEDVTCRGGAPRGANVTEFCIVSNDSSTVVSRVHAYWCTTCFIGPGTWENSFVNLNGTIPKEHYEDIYFGGGPSSITIRHNTLLEPPHDQGDVATIFLSTDFGDQHGAVIENNFLAGGGWLLYGGGTGAKGRVGGPMTYTGNRVSTLFAPRGGVYGIGAYFNRAVTRWANNYWDASLRPIAAP